MSIKTKHNADTIKIETKEYFYKNKEELLQELEGAKARIKELESDLKLLE